jgi:hypothetical protein
MDYLETILKKFPIDTGSAKQLHLKKTDQNTRLYKVDLTKSPIMRPINGEAYLIDTPAGRKVACHPHIVGDKLAPLCLEAANELVSVLREFSLVSEKSGILHILRGGMGYCINKALPEIPVINIRTKYSEDGYRAHSDDSRRIQVTYSDYHSMSLDSLIVPDTYATGRSVEAAFQHMFEWGLDVERVIIYGFIAAPGLEIVNKLLAKHEIPLYVFAICDISQLYSNNYDMPLYGLDEHLHKQSGVIKPLGSIVSLETLRDMVPYYVPGMDQPGDWSERHTELFNGYGKESGDLLGHLKKSIELMEALDELNSQQPWYIDEIREITRREIEACRELIHSTDSC